MFHKVVQQCKGLIPLYTQTPRYSTLIQGTQLTQTSTVLATTLHKLHQLKVIKRHGSIFNLTSGKDLWKSVTGVSNAGKKRGRARAGRRARAKNLNLGQHLGEGKSRMLFPGLNSPVVVNKSLLKQKPLEPKDDYQEKLNRARDMMQKFKPLKLTPIERGWTGTKITGMKLSPPFAEIQETDEWKEFSSVCVETKLIRLMKKEGRLRLFRSTVIVGNGYGLIGFGEAMADSGHLALLEAKKKAGVQLFHVPRNGNTIFHDVNAGYGTSRVIIRRRGAGYGLKCQRTLKVIFDMLGITDLTAKIIGNTTAINLIKATLIALLKQKTHQELANQKGLIVARISPGAFTEVVARPEGPVRTQSQLSPMEELNYEQYANEGFLYDPKPEKTESEVFGALPSYQCHLRKLEHNRHHKLIKFRLASQYGRIKSEYSDKYPEANYGFKMPKVAEEEEF